jgi:hypothetical protein
MLDEEYQNSVDFSEAEEAFTEVVGTALSSLVCNVEGRMESALSTMIKVTLINSALVAYLCFMISYTRR